MNCEEVGPRLTSCLLGDLDAESSKAVKGHLDECEGCRALAREIEPTLDLLRDALAAASSKAPAKLSPERMRRIERAVAAPAWSPGLWFTQYHRALAIAASVLVALGITLMAVNYGSVAPYRVPKGSGSPDRMLSVAGPVDGTYRSGEADLHAVKKMKKRIVAAPESSTSFYYPDLDGSTVLAEVDKDTSPSHVDGWQKAEKGVEGDGLERMGMGGGGGIGVGYAGKIDTVSGDRVEIEPPRKTADDRRRVAELREVMKKYPASAEANAAHMELERMGVKMGGGIEEPGTEVAATFQPKFKAVSGKGLGAGLGTGHGTREFESVDTVKYPFTVGGVYGSRAPTPVEQTSSGENGRLGETDARRDADGRKTAETWYKGGSEQLKRDDTDEAYRTFKKLAWDYPESQWAKYARGRLSESALAGEDKRENAKPRPGEEEGSSRSAAAAAIDNRTQAPGPALSASRAEEQLTLGDMERGTRRHEATDIKIGLSSDSPLQARDLVDSRVVETVDKESQVTYGADMARTFSGTKGSARGGKMGKGGGGEGGWPDGMENSVVRFIRLQYDGPGWDDGMDVNSRADMNFLDAFHKLTGFKVGARPESHGISLLAKYPKGYAPPFVYMTGSGDIKASDREVKILRDYLAGGGMLFADCGSPQWNSSFQNFMQRVFPSEPLQPIADDDTILQVPFAFVNGAPPLRHYGGTRAMGIKSKGRWSVFYHPGDVKTAWKSDRGGLDPKQAEGATELGVNVVYYSFSNYLEQTRKYRDGNAAANEPAKPPPPPPSEEPAPPRKPRPAASHFNPFVNVTENPFSTFAIDVDTASYTLARNYMLKGYLPPAEAVRTEEFVNFFDYAYTPPSTETFNIFADCAPSKFGRGLHALKIGVRGHRLGKDEQRKAVLTLLVDTSGSMDQADRLGLVKKSLRMLVGQLAPYDKVAIVQYDAHARVVLEHTPVSDLKKILAAIDGLECGGSTNLEEGMEKAYILAGRDFAPGGENRVILLSDGVANLGSGAAGDILGKVEKSRRQGIFCSVFGFGMGTYNDEMLETLANKGDGIYRFIDSEDEAKRVLVDEISSTLNTIARDVKIQVEFNPDLVARYRQLGYENRQLKKEDFRNDAIDAGEVGSGQSVTALYELDLSDAGATRAARIGQNRIATVRVRYMRTDTGRIEEVEHPMFLSDLMRRFEDTDARFRLAACVAEFAEILRGSPYADGSEFKDVAQVLRPAARELNLDTRVAELLRIVESAEHMSQAPAGE